MKASEEGHKEVFESLLSAGADVNHQNRVCDIDDCCVYVMFLKIFL